MTETQSSVTSECLHYPDRYMCFSGQELHIIQGGLPTIIKLGKLKSMLEIILAGKRYILVHHSTSKTHYVKYFDEHLDLVKEEKYYDKGMGTDDNYKNIVLVDEKKFILHTFRSFISFEVGGERELICRIPYAIHTPYYRIDEKKNITITSNSILSSSLASIPQKIEYTLSSYYSKYKYAGTEKRCEYEIHSSNFNLLDEFSYHNLLYLPELPEPIRKNYESALSPDIIHLHHVGKTLYVILYQIHGYSIDEWTLQEDGYRKIETTSFYHGNYSSLSKLLNQRIVFFPGKVAWVVGESYEEWKVRIVKFLGEILTMSMDLIRLLVEFIS